MIVRRSEKIGALAIAMTLALACSGCCEVMHLGWGRRYSSSTWREVRSLDAPTRKAARVLDNGTLDSATCDRACRSGGSVQVIGCYPATVAIPADATAPAPVPAPDDVYVVCKMYRPAGCGSSTLSKLGLASCG